MKVSLRLASAHAPAHELGLAGDWKRRMKPRAPFRAMRVAKHLCHRARRYAIERRETAAVGDLKLQRIALELRRKEFPQQGLAVRGCALRFLLAAPRGIPQQQLREMVDALAVHGRDHAVERRRLNARNLRRG